VESTHRGGRGGELQAVFSQAEDRKVKGGLTDGEGGFNEIGGGNAPTRRLQIVPLFAKGGLEGASDVE
jgi:hypothetical protein